MALIFVCDELFIIFIASRHVSITVTSIGFSPVFDTPKCEETAPTAETPAYRAAQLLSSTKDGVSPALEGVLGFRQQALKGSRRWD